MAIPNPIQQGSNPANLLIKSASSFLTDCLESTAKKLAFLGDRSSTSSPSVSAFDKSTQALASLSPLKSLGENLYTRAHFFAAQSWKVISLSTQLCIQNIRREIAIGQLPPAVRKAFENRAGIDRLNTAIQATDNRIKLLEFLSKDTQMSFSQKESILQILAEDLARTQAGILKEEDQIAPELKDSEWLKMLGEEETVYAEKSYTETSTERFNNEDAVGTVGKDLKAPGDFVHERENSYILNIKSDAAILENKREVEHYNYAGVIGHLQQWASNQKHAQVMHLKMRIVGDLKSAGLEHLPQNEIPELYTRLRSYGDQISSEQVQSELDRATLRQPILTQAEITHQMAQKLFESGEKIEGFAELEAGFTKAKQLYDQGRYSEAKRVFLENYKNPLREKLALRFKEIVQAEIEKNKVSYTVSLALITVAAVAATVLTDGLGTAFAIRGIQWGLGEFFCNATLFYASHEALTMGYEYLTGREVQIKNLDEHGIDLLLTYGMLGSVRAALSHFQTSVKESLATRYFEKTGRVLNEAEKDFLLAKYIQESGLKEKLAYYSQQFGVEYGSLLAWNGVEGSIRSGLEGHFDLWGALKATFHPDNLVGQAFLLLGLKVAPWAVHSLERFFKTDLGWAMKGEEGKTKIPDIEGKGPEFKINLVWEEIVARLQSGENPAALAREMNGSEATGGLRDMRVARKVISVLQDLEALKQNPEMQAQRKASLIQGIRDVVTDMSQGTSLSVKELIKILEKTEGAEFLTSAYKMGRVDIRMVSEAEYQRCLQKMGKSEQVSDTHSILGMYLQDSFGYKNTILVREMPSLNLKEAQAKNQAMGEVLRRLETLIHEGEHWRHFNGFFQGIEREGTKLNPTASDVQTLTVAEMLAYLEQARWLTLNFDSTYLKEAASKDQNLAQYFRNYIGRYYLGE